MLQITQFSLFSEALDVSKYHVTQAEILRPGQKRRSMLYLLCLKESSYDIWTELKAHYSSASGTCEEALEHAVKRTNESIIGTSRAPFGSVIACAVDGQMCAAATGGNAAAYLGAHGKLIDISPETTPSVREKFFGALTAGAYHQQTIILSLSPLSTAERDAFGRAEEASRGMYDGVIIKPFVPASWAEKFSLIAAWTMETGRTLVSSATYRDLYKILKSWARNPRATYGAVRNVCVRAVRILLNYVKGLSRTRKVYAVAGIIAVAVILRSFLIAVGGQNVEEIIAETLSRENKIAGLIAAQHDAQALVALDETLALLDQAPSHLTELQSETLKNLRMRLLRTASDLNHVYIIPSPVPVVSMEKSFRESRSFDLAGLALAQGKLYTVNRAEHEVYELDGRERRIVVIKDFPQGAGDPVGIAASVPGYVNVLTENPRGVLALNTKTRTFLFAPLALPRADARPVAFAAYNQKMYMLDARSRAIYRYELTPTGFDLWSPWTDETSLDFSQATTFAIDGAIYVTFSNHDIVKLVQGARQSFVIDKIRPPLDKVTAIATKEGSPFLYLLDPPQRRVLIIAKENGSLVAQYTSPLFDDLRGLFPDEAAKKIYLLNGDTIYAVGPDDKSILDE